jgi:hypothetical protein
MLASALVGKQRGRLLAEQATYARLAWNLAYWQLAPVGEGQACNPLDARFGWQLTPEGVIQRSTHQPQQGGFIQLGCSGTL